MERQTITGRLSTSGRLSGALSVGGGTTDYNELENKPTYNGHIIEGDLTNESLGIWQPKNFSTEEQSTGIKWIDGSDIYYKVIDLGTDTTIRNDQWLFNAFSIPDIKLIFNCFGINSQNTGTYYPLIAYIAGTNINLLASRHNGYATCRYIVFFYIKN